MPRSRGSELQQRQSPRAPLHLKTMAESNRSAVDRSASAKLDDRRSARNSNPLQEKKRGTRVADLEAKLGKAQEELKKLREQLMSAETAKKDAQTALETAKKHVGKSEKEGDSAALTGEEEVINESETQEESKDESLVNEESPELKAEEESVVIQSSDVFEVVVPSEMSENKENVDENGEVIAMEKTKEEQEDQEEEETKKKILESVVVLQEEKEEIKKDDDELAELKAKLIEREREMEALAMENAEIKTKAERLEEGKRAAEAAKAALEAELRRLRVQTDQWRKAAEAAAAVLASGDGDMAAEGRRVAGRCGSMDKNLIGIGWGSPVIGEEDEGKRRGGPGIRMFGELWKKKGGQK